MKKRITQKVLATVAVACLFIGGAWAQVETTGDYVFIPGTFSNTWAATTPTDSVTAGSTTRLYVLPDLYYHPNYTAVGSYTLTSGFNWRWTGFMAGIDTSRASLPAPLWNNIRNNYINVIWPAAAGPSKITVTENAPTAFGGCSGDTNVWVQVIAPPSVAFRSGAGYINANLSACETEPNLANNVGATLTGIRSFRLQWSLEIATLSNLGAKDEYFALDWTSIGTTTADSAVHYGNTVTNLPATVTGAVSPVNIDFSKPTYGFVAHDHKTTVYTYTLSGINDRISRKSDYLINPTASAIGWTWYDTTADRIVITVYPAPVTGPIYHIPNNWAD